MLHMRSTWLPHIHLEAWRNEKGFTQERLGNILGVGKSAISRWENGKRHMNMEDVERIANVFEIEPLALFRAPGDYGKAKAIDDFAKLIEEIGLERVKMILEAFKKA